MSIDNDNHSKYKSLKKMIKNKKTHYSIHSGTKNVVNIETKSINIRWYFTYSCFIDNSVFVDNFTKVFVFNICSTNIVTFIVYLTVCVRTYRYLFCICTVLEFHSLRIYPYIRALCSNYIQRIPRHLLRPFSPSTVYIGCLSFVRVRTRLTPKQ